MSSAYIIVRSEDRDKKIFKSPSRFTLADNVASFAARGITSIEADSFEMLYFIPNINARNNGIVFDNGSQSFLILVPEGFYSYPDLAAAIENEMNAVIGAGHTLQWNVGTMRFDLVAPNPLKVTKYPPQRRDLAAVIGFDYDKPLSLFIYGGCADLNYTRNIYVTSSSLNRNKSLNDQSSRSSINDVLLVCPVFNWSEYWNIQNRLTSGYDTLLKPRNIYHSPNVPKRVRFNPDETVSNIDILLLDDQGEELYNPYESTDPERASLFGCPFTLNLIANRN